MKCCRCDAEATFESPRDFCDEHWARWWAGFDEELPYEDGEPPSDEMYQEALALIKEHDEGARLLLGLL